MAKDKTKLPKRLAGVKIPKALRKGGEKLLDQANSPEGRAAIARGVTTVVGAAAMMAQAAAAKKTATAEPVVDDPASPPAPPGTPGAPGTPGMAGPDALSNAIGAGVEAVLGRLFPRK